MKAVTGNRLSDGRVVYLAPNDTWTDHMNCAAQFSDEDAVDVLAAAKTRVTEIAEVYLIEVEGKAAAGREALRETIRSAGPTVRTDLCKEAGRGR